jgi:Mrp family chromosome partitioning ATPase
VQVDAGLSELLAGTGGDRVIELSPTLHVLPAGAPTNDPMGPLSSPRLVELMEHAREAYDWTIVDSPPIGLISDASLLTTHVDGVLLVVAANQTPVDLVERAVVALGRERILGVVLNKAEEREVMGGSGYYYNYYHYYRRYYGAARAHD